MKRTRRQAGFANTKKKTTKKRRYATARPRRRFVNAFPDGMPDGIPRTAISARARSGVSSKVNVKLKYHDTYTMLTPGPVFLQVFRANSLFDPDFTGTGHQPMGFDQYATLYRRYRVNAVLIEATAINTNVFNTQPSPMLVSIYPDLSNTGFRSMNALIEQPNVSYDYLSPTGADSIKKVTLFTQLHNLYGVTKKQYVTEQQYASFTNGSPVIVSNINLQGNTISGNDAATYYSVRLTYYVTFYEPRTLDQS